MNWLDRSKARGFNSKFILIMSNRTNLTLRRQDYLEIFRRWTRLPGDMLRLVIETVLTEGRRGRTRDDFRYQLRGFSRFVNRYNADMDDDEYPAEDIGYVSARLYRRDQGNSLLFGYDPWFAREVVSMRDAMGFSHVYAFVSRFIRTLRQRVQAARRRALEGLSSV